MKFNPSQPVPQLRLVYAIYIVRIIAFVYCLALCLLLIYERSYWAGAYLLAVLHFLGLPHLLYLRSRQANEPRNAEMQHLLLDALLFGAWIGGFGFPAWYLFSGLLGVVLANIANMGMRGLMYSLIAFALGAAGLSWVNDFQLQPWTSPLLAALCLVGVFAYTCTLGLVVYKGAQRLVSTRQELRDNEMRFRLITENAGDLIALFDIEGNTLYSSPSYETHLGRKLDQTTINIIDHIHPEDSAKFRKALAIEANATKANELRYRMINNEGRTIYFKARTRAILQDGKLGIVIVSTDVTLEQEHDRQKRLIAEVMLNLGEAVMVWNAEGKILSVNKAFSKLTGYESEEVIGQQESEYRHALQPPEYYEKISRQLENSGRWRGSSWTRRKDRSLYKERRSVSAIQDENSKVMLFIAIFFEIDKGTPPPDTET